MPMELSGALSKGIKNVYYIMGPISGHDKAMSYSMSVKVSCVKYTFFDWDLS